MPTIGLEAGREIDGAVRLSGPDVAVPPDTRLRFSLPGGPSLALPAAAIADDPAPRAGDGPGPAQWRRMATLARMLGTGRATLRFMAPDGQMRSNAVPAARRGIRDLPPRYWSAWLTALAALLLGQWVWIVRHHDGPSRQFALRSAGLALAAFPVAAGGDAPLATPHYRWLLAANGLGTMIFGAGLVAMLSRFPLPLLTPRWSRIGLAGCVSVAVAQTFELVDEGARLIGLACGLVFATTLALLAAQLVASRRDSAARHAATIIAASTGVAMTVVFGVTIVPIIARIGQPVHVAFVFPLILVVHAGVAAAVLRTRIARFDGWTRTATRRAAADVALAAIDVALVTAAWSIGGIRLTAIAVALAAAHVALRSALRRRRDASERLRERELLRRITQLALASDPRQREALWRDALHLAFALGRGLTLAEAGAVLGISAQTVATHVKAIYRKLNIASRAEAALEAHHRGLA